MQIQCSSHSSKFECLDIVKTNTVHFMDSWLYSLEYLLSFTHCRNSRFIHYREHGILAWWLLKTWPNYTDSDFDMGVTGQFTFRALSYMSSLHGSSVLMTRSVHCQCLSSPYIWKETVFIPIPTLLVLLRGLWPWQHWSRLQQFYVYVRAAKELYKSN